METLVTKNPGNNNGRTPLHLAAFKGKSEVCTLIMENLEDKNPGDNNGRTPLHEAAYNGHLKVCKLICKNIEDKNPLDNFGKTPRNYAFNWRIWIFLTISLLSSSRHYVIVFILLTVLLIAKFYLIFIRFHNVFEIERRSLHFKPNHYDKMWKK